MYIEKSLVPATKHVAFKSKHSTEFTLFAAERRLTVSTVFKSQLFSQPHALISLAEDNVAEKKTIENVRHTHDSDQPFGAAKTEVALWAIAGV